MPAADATKIRKYNLEERILELSVGRTTTQVAQALTSELQAKGIPETISQTAVSRYLRKVWASRAEETRNIVQEHIKTYVPKDMTAIEEIETWLLERFRGRVDLAALAGTVAKEVAAIIEADHGKRAEYGMKAARLIELKLKYAGILENPEAPNRGIPGDPVDLTEFRSEIAKEGASAKMATH